MKDSVVEWIGEIPDGWIFSQVKYEFINLDEKRQPISSEFRGDIEGVYDYYGASGIIDKINDYLFDETLLLIGEDGANLVMRNLPLIYIAKGKYWVNNHAHVLKPKETNNLYYMAYQLESIDLFPFITGSTQPKLTQDKLSIIPVIVPPLPTQNRIASFLDTKSSLIESAVQKERDIIEKLKEYRQAVITEAVTKGILPGVPMKDSGVEWIGEIPEGWEVCKIKYLARLQSGDILPSEKISNDGAYPVYGGNGLRGYTDAFTHSGSYILIGRQGALCGNVHVVNGDFWPSEHAIVTYELTELNQNWFAYVLYAMNLNQYSTSAAQPGLAIDKIRELFVSLPPLPEQQEIADYLDAKCSAIDATIQKRELAIEKLTAYKQSLIYECVTGKKEVLG